MCKSKSLWVALLASTAWSGPLLAQTVPQYITPDRNGVDLTTGLPWLGFEEGGIGSGPGRVAMQRYWATGAGWVDNWSGGLFVVSGGSQTYVQLGGIADTFSQAPKGGGYVNFKGNGSTLELVGSTFIYTMRDGTRIEYPDEPFDLQTSSCAGADPSTCRVPTTVTKPNGLKFQLGWDAAQLCIQSSGGTCTHWMSYKRLASVTSSAGYSLAIAYATNSPGTGTEPVADWYKRTTVAFNNSASPISPPPTVTYAYPSSNVVTITDPAARTWRLTTTSSGQLTGIRFPGSTHDDISYAYGSSGTISSATNEGITSGYSLVTPATGLPYMQVTDALGKTITVTIAGSGRPSSYEDQLGHLTQFNYDVFRRLQLITFPELNSVEFTYDHRGNVTDTTFHPKSGSTTLATHASYDSTCSNLKTCNQPNTTTDANGDVTTYHYDSTHGGVTAILPSKANGASVQPETDIGYTQIASASGDQIWMPTQVSACQTQDAGSCGGTADERRTTVQYNANLLPSSITSGDGTGALASTTALGYDARGNRTTLDGPLADDTWAYKYDAADRLTGTISPSPDASVPLKNRAARTTYLPNGLVSQTDIGTTSGQSDADFAAMVVLQSAQTYYDGNWRPNMSRLLGGTSRQTQTQYSYDTLGRLSCTAVRMDRAQFTNDVSLDACILGTNAGDPDRITKLVYDDAGEIVQSRVAYGVSGPNGVADQTVSYTPNGKVQYLIDGEGQKSGFIYDEFDRLSQRQYPSTTRPSAFDDSTQTTALATAGAVDTTDYEQFTYDPGGNVIAQRSRSGSNIGLSYDHRDNLVLKDLPGTESDVTYRYDNFNRLTAAFQSDSAGAVVQTVKFTWDALSRNIDQTGPQGTAHSDYDLAGRRTKFTYPGSGFYVNYDYLNTGEVTKIREKGATSGKGVLATYGYDDLGNRTSLTLGNTVVTSYTYDAVSRLSRQTADFAGTVNDLTIDSIAYNPASQLTTLRRNNTAYSWTATGSGSTAYMPNGLNQYASIGGATPSYDTNGNMLTEPQSGKSYSYTSENLLSAAAGGGASSATLTYDPLMRLYQDQPASGAVTRFAYDGMDMIAEYDGSNALQKRTVFGAGTNEPLVQYDAAGNRTWLTADERGSIVALSDDSGTVTQVNRYDEYGKPQPGNTGRFQYTGQAWLDDLGTAPASGQGLYYYRSRMYAPHLGRFMQTDPIGYAGGLNLYAYVLNDPVNLVDPLGLQATGTPEGGGDGSGQDPNSVTVVGCRGLLLYGICSHIAFDLSSLTQPQVNFGFGFGLSSVAAAAAGDGPADKTCAQGNGSVFARIAGGAGTVGNYADGVGLGAATLGIATAPTGAGGAFFGGAAIIAGVVGRGAAVVQTGAYALDGNYKAAASSLLGLVGGELIGRAAGGLSGRFMARNRMFGDLSAGQQRRANLFGNTAGAAGSRIVSRMVCK